MILLRIPVRERPEMQLKAIACGALQKKRKYWGYTRHWQGNYLSIQTENTQAQSFENALTHLRRSHGIDKVLFSCNVSKVSGWSFTC